ncbi:MAG: hypothetical protein ABUT20_29765 [Bacteroidota bacterium]
MLSGSMALSTYTVPRFTRDLDFVVHLKPEYVPLFVSSFKDGYYCDEDSIRDAIRNKTMFNIIDHKSNYKADIVILKNEHYRQVEFERRKQVDFSGLKIYIVSPEDLLLSKLIWIQELQSSLQMDDIRQLKEINGLDLSYIHQWIDELKLNTFGVI